MAHRRALAATALAANFRACSGAKIADVTNTQLSALTSSTSYVTISVGGNDAGFADVLTTCAQPAWLSNCTAAVDRAQAYIRNTLPGALTTLYGQIRSRAPQAKVTVVGYTRIFNGTDCNALTWFSSTEMSRLNATADLINSTTSARAGAAGFSFANPTSRFVGHAVCGSPERQRPYAAADRTIRPEVVRAPDLTTPQARAAAARAGVDLSSRASIDAADRRYAAREAAAFLAR